MSGKFITFEGIDGSGKTTQAALFAEYLRSLGHDVVLTKDPGGSPLSFCIRSLLVEGEPGSMDEITELLLFTAARRDLVRHTIKPALDAGKWVVCDRYVDSTVAYQGFGNGLLTGHRRLLEDLDVAGTMDVLPDLTIIIDVPVDVGMARAVPRPGCENRFERKGRSYMETVKRGFDFVYNECVGRVIKIDGTWTVEKVAEMVRDQANWHLNLNK